MNNEQQTARIDMKCENCGHEEPVHWSRCMEPGCPCAEYRPAEPRNDVERLPGVTFKLEDFASAEDFLDFVSGDVGIDVAGVANGFLKNETVEALGREGWHKSAIAAMQAMSRFWLDNQPPDHPKDGMPLTNTVAVPVRYDDRLQCVLDATDRAVADIRGMYKSWPGITNGEWDPLRLRLGEHIAKCINSFQVNQEQIAILKHQLKNCKCNGLRVKIEE